MSGHSLKYPICILLLFVFSVFAGCKKDQSTKSISNSDFAYSGSQYLGGMLSFTTMGVSDSNLLWSFGDSSTSASGAPYHSYGYTGKFIVSMMINGNPSNVISKTIYIGADSAHQAMASGIAMWHKRLSGYEPTTQRDTVLHYNDTSLAVQSIHAGVITFVGDTMSYSSSTDSTINFSSIHYAVPNLIYSADAWSSFQYNYITNKIVYSYEYHESAASGNWTFQYTSF